MYMVKLKSNPKDDADEFIDSVANIISGRSNNNIVSVPQLPPITTTSRPKLAHTTTAPKKSLRRGLLGRQPSKTGSVSIKAL